MPQSLREIVPNYKNDISLTCFYSKQYQDTLNVAPSVAYLSFNMNKLEIRSVHNRRIERLNSVILLPFSFYYKNLQMRQMWMCNADVSLYRRWYIPVSIISVKIYRKQWYIYLMMMWSKWVKQYPICRHKNKQGKWIRWQLLHKVYNVEFNFDN